MQEVRDKLLTGDLSGHLAVVIIDSSGTVSLADGSGAAAFGISPEKLRGRSVFDTIQSSPILMGIQRALSGKADEQVLDIGDKTFEVRCEPRSGGGAIVFAVDATERRQAEEEPRASDRYLRIVFRQVPGAIWATDRDLRITSALGRVSTMTGLDPRQAVGVTIQEFVGARDPTEPAVAHHLAALAGKAQSFQYEFRGRWFEVLVEPLKDEQGDILGCVGAAIDATERRLFEVELAAGRRRIEEAQRVAHVGSFEWDVEPNVVTWSDELHRIYGIEIGQFGGTYEAFLERVHPDDLLYTKNVVLDAFRRIKPFVYDHRIVRPDGSVRMLHTRGDVIADKGGKPLRIVGSCWDVTELKDTTQNLERALSLLQATINATADGVLVVDREGKVTAHNQRFLTLWRIPAELAEKRDDEKLLAFVLDQLEDPDSFLRGVRELYGHPDRESFDILRFKDGRVFERYSIPQRIGEEVVGRVWSFLDVTERERLFGRAVFLADATRLLASLDVEPALGSVAHMAVPYLGDGCAVDLLDNGGPRRLLAVSRDPRRPISPELHSAVLAGHPTIYSVGPLSCLAVPMMAKGAVAGAMTFVAPPSRRYTPEDLELAEELARRAALSLENARLYRGAQEALRARDEFLSIAAHEIRAPVTSIHLAVQNLQKSELAGPANLKLLEVMERQDQRLARFVDELLDLDRIRTGRLHFTFEEVDLGTVVRDVAARLGAELAKTGSSLSITTDGRPVGQWDRLRLDQVVTNLLLNAIKFGMGKPIDVTIRARAHDGRARLTVKDQGVGISAKMQERIFHPFERAVSSRHYGGLGLGLYIVRTILEGLGGQVRVESEPGAGSTFTVELPQTR
jgi:PAS domain S-box-containing protein